MDGPVDHLQGVLGGVLVKQSHIPTPILVGPEDIGLPIAPLRDVVRHTWENAPGDSWHQGRVASSPGPVSP